MDASTVLKGQYSGLALVLSAEPMQLSILCRPRDVQSVCDRESGLGAVRNLLSYHLKVFRDAGLVDPTRRSTGGVKIRPERLDQVIKAIDTLALAPTRSREIA